MGNAKYKYILFNESAAIITSIKWPLVAHNWGWPSNCSPSWPWCQQCQGPGHSGRPTIQELTNSLRDLAHVQRAIGTFLDSQFSRQCQVQDGKDRGWNTGRFPAFQAVPRLNRQRRQNDTTVDNNRGDNKDANRQSEEDDSGGADYGVFDNIFGSERSKSGRSGPKKLIHHGTRSSSWSKGGIPDPAPPWGYLHQPNLVTDQKLGKDYVQDPVQDIDALNNQPRQNNRRGSRANYKA